MNLRFKAPRIYDPRLGRTRPNHLAIHVFGRRLEAEGWTYSAMNGGYISPDHSAIYYVDRSGHNGKVMRYSQNGDYRKTIAALWKTGCFKAYLSEMERRQLNATKTRAVNFIGTAASTIPFVAVFFLMVFLA